MGVESVPEMSENLHILTQLSAQENFIECKLSYNNISTCTDFLPVTKMVKILVLVSLIKTVVGPDIVSFSTSGVPRNFFRGGGFNKFS